MTRNAFMIHSKAAGKESASFLLFVRRDLVHKRNNCTKEYLNFHCILTRYQLFVFVFL